jgi:predicted CXXCH cytochrome family protein
MDARGLPYHNGPTLICADCHELAAGAQDPSLSQPVVEDPDSPVATDPSPGTGGHLNAGDVNGLCLFCHAGRRGVPDVMGPDINGLGERSAGEFEVAGASNRHGHDLGPSLTCVSCHDPHGNGNPRNLRVASDPDAEVSLGLFIRPGSKGLDRYERRNVAYGTLDSPALREVSALCLDCHGSAIGPTGQQKGTHGGYLRHPSYDSPADQVNRISDGGLRGSTAPAYWDLGIGTDFEVVPRVPFVTAGANGFFAAAQVDAGRNGVFCLSCHSAHGTGNPFGLRWSQTGSEGVAGCNQCHAKGRKQTADQLTQADPAWN